MHINEAFVLLKSVCDRVVKNPTKENLRDLEESIDKISSEELQPLQDYVLFPLELSLKRPDVKSNAKIFVINCIKKLVHCTKIDHINKFFQLLSIIFVQLFDKKSSNMVGEVSEELKLSVIQCATELIHKSSENVICDIYNKANTRKLSQEIFMCQQMMQNEKLRSLRIAAIEFIMAITQVDAETEESSLLWRPNVADTIMFFVPGLLTGLHKVAIGDEKQGHWVTLMALRAWCRILVLVLEDIPLENVDQKISFSAKVTERLEKNRKKFRKPESKNHEEYFKEMQLQKRTLEWATDVAENVGVMVEKLHSLQQNNHWKVRLELVNACRLLLDRCHRHLKNTSVILVEILLKLSDDNTRQVASQSEAAIEHLAKILEKESGVSLFETLEENIFGLITKLPRVFHVELDDAKLSELSLLKQYLRLLGPGQLPLLLQSAPHLQRTMEALLQAAELQSFRLTLLEDCSLRDLEFNQDPAVQSSWKQFKHFSDNKVLEKLEEVLRLLGKYGDTEVLTSHLLDMFSTESEHRNEVVFVLNEILVGGAGADGLDHIVKNILNVYLSQEVWYVPLAATDDASHDSRVTAGQARANLQLACLLVEGVGCAATCLGDQFRFFLMRVMYPVVERAGSPHKALSAAGLQAAAAVACAVGQGMDITALLQANMDYFMVQVTLRLRNLHRSTGVLNVLSVAMRHSNQNMLLHLQNTVSDVLLKSCDTFQRHHTTSFLQVFYTFFICIRKWFVSTPSEPEGFSTTRSHSDPVEIIRRLTEYCRNSQLSRETDDDMKSVDEMYAEDCAMAAEEERLGEGLHPGAAEEEKKSEVPAHVKIAVSILQRCLHLLPSKDRHCRLLALEALQEGLEVLRDHEDQLLPTVHKVWSPLVGRLQDTGDALLLNRSFLLLCTLARLAKDFLRARTLKQVMPSLSGFLRESASKSMQKDSGSAFRFTQLFKLQLCLLDGLGPLVVHLQLQEKELHQLLTAAAPYLSVLQPQPLQESCVKMMKIIATYDADAVWLEIIKIKRMMTSKFRDNKEYIKNAETVLQYLSTLEAVRNYCLEQ